MRTKNRVILGGKYLDQVGATDEYPGDVVIQKIECKAAKTSMTATSRLGPGQRLSATHRDYQEVLVTFTIRLRKEKFKERSQLFEDISTWAKEGQWLRITAKPNRRLYIDYIELPDEGNDRDFGQEYKLTLRAYSIPFWMEYDATSKAVKKKASGSMTCEVAGNTDTVMDVTLKNVSGKAISSASVTAGSSTIAFTGLDFQKNDELLIEHMTNGLLRLRIHRATGTPGYVSVMGNRTPASSDDLYVSPGNATVTWKCDRACDVTVTWRGRFK